MKIKYLLTSSDNPAMVGRKETTTKLGASTLLRKGDEVLIGEKTAMVGRVIRQFGIPGTGEALADDAEIVLAWTESLSKNDIDAARDDGFVFGEEHGED